MCRLFVVKEEWNSIGRKRLIDILRWAAAEELIIGKSPMGALFIGSNLSQHYGNELKYDQASDNNLFLTGIKEMLFVIFCLFPPSTMPQGWQFKANRDYLQPIQERMLNLMDGLWKQNPGW